jgi:hypothetical protein
VGWRGGRRSGDGLRAREVGPILEVSLLFFSLLFFDFYFQFNVGDLFSNAMN